MLKDYSKEGALFAISDTIIAAIVYIQSLPVFR
jgi:hypothetical protein